MVEEITTDNGETVLSGLAEEIRGLAEALDKQGKLERGHWIEIGQRMAQARDTLGGANREFRKWLKGSGLISLPQIATASVRSDAMWLADRPDAAAIIPESIGHPKTVRSHWRRRLGEEAEGSADEFAGVDPWAEEDENVAFLWGRETDLLVEKLHATPEEARAAIERVLSKAASDLAEAEGAVAEDRFLGAFEGVEHLAQQLAEQYAIAFGAAVDLRNEAIDEIGLDGAETLVRSRMAAAIGLENEPSVSAEVTAALDVIVHFASMGHDRDALMEFIRTDPPRWPAAKKIWGAKLAKLSK